MDSRFTAFQPVSPPTTKKEARRRGALHQLWGPVAYNLRQTLVVLTVLLVTCLPALTETLPGTEPLTSDGDLAAQMLEGLDRFLSHRLATSVEYRQSFWKLDFSSREAYEDSIIQNRERFRRIIGVVDERIPFDAPALDATLNQPALVGIGSGYQVFAVRWPVFDGVDGEGLLLEPAQTPVARVVALPDADWTPEMLVGLAPGIPTGAQYARRLAENGCQVLVPVLIDRQATGLVNPRITHPTDQTHREFIYRMAFQMGRHIIGYEVQKVLAAVDWFCKSQPARPIGVIGYGEGGLLALYSAAADTRIDTAAVSGYYQSRQDVWREPIYRNVWGLLVEFGDAELASLIAPRALVIEASRGPEITGPSAVTTQSETEVAPGNLVTPLLADTRAEFERAKPFYENLRSSRNLSLVISEDGRGDPGSASALAGLLRALHVKARLKPQGNIPKDRRRGFTPATRQHRQFEQLVEFTQAAIRRSDFVRKQFWSKIDISSIEKWNQSKETYRRYLWEEVLGKLPSPSEPMSARTRCVYDRPRWKGYEVVLPVWPDVFAYGVLLVPKDLKPGQKRPVVVCQHGRAGRPQDLIEPTSPRMESVYKRFAAQLADRGFIVYAPQSFYIFEGQYRILQRKANPLKLSLFSFVLGQHQRTLEWLSQLPFVDAKRIGFYGLSYGGKTAVRVPPLLDRYALSICSGDFNEYAGKIAGTDRPDSFIFTDEYEVYEFNLGNTYNYSDLANLMAPRPFMVERGHKDGVGLDEWVAYEYAKVRRFYTFLGIPERTTIEFFNGVHEIHGVGTFRFLHEYLNWPEP